MISVKLNNADAITRRFLSLERKVAGNIVKKAVRAGLRPMNQALKAATEYTDRTGRLRRAFRVGVRARNRGLLTIGKTTTAVRSKRGKERAGYAHLVEKGHRIAAKGVTLKRNAHDSRSGGWVRGRFYGRNAFRRSNATALRAFESRYIVEIYSAVRA